MRRRMGRPGLVGTMARTAVIAGTATATSNAVNRRGQAPPPPAPAAPAAPAAGPGDDLVAKISELAQLHQQGILTDEEFSAAKMRLLA
jgi:hypothetical protein